MGATDRPQRAGLSCRKDEIWSQLPSFAVASTRVLERRSARLLSPLSESPPPEFFACAICTQVHPFVAVVSKYAAFSMTSERSLACLCSVQSACLTTWPAAVFG